MALVIAGYQLPNDSTTALTRANLNLMGVPTVTIQSGEIVDSMVTSVSGSKILSGTLPLSAMTTATQARATGGIKNFIPNPQFDLWDSASPITMQTGTNPSSHGHSYYNTNATTIPGTITQAAVTPGLSDSLLGNAKWWYQVATTGTGAVQLNVLNVTIPNARLFSGQQVTLSMISQVFSGTLPTISTTIAQNFGTGVSPSSIVYTNSTFNVQPAGTVAQQYSTFTLPSVSGKTFGTNGDDYLLVSIIIASCTTSFTLGITNVQLELSNLATTFENSLSRNTGFDANINNGTMQGRLTLTSGDPYMLTGDATSASNIYWSPVNGNRVTLWDGNVWREIPVPEIAFSLSGAANSTVYDLFGYYNGSSMAIAKLAWTNSTTRATAVTLQDGVWCLSGNKMWRLLGSFATTSSGVCSIVRTGSGAGGGNAVQILLDNVYNRLPTVALVVDTAASWTYPTNTWEQLHGPGSTTAASPNYNAIQVLQSLTTDLLDIRFHCGVTDSSSSIQASIGIGTSTSSPLALAGAFVIQAPTATNVSPMPMTVTACTGSLGLTTYYPLEKASGATVTFYGYAGVNNEGMVLKKNF